MTRIKHTSFLLLATLTATLMSNGPVSAQGPALGVNIMSPVSRLGGAGAWTNSIGWINDQNLLDELQVVAEQRADLLRLRDETLKKRKEFYESYRSVPQEKRGAFMKEFGELLSADVDTKVNSILLPHQKERLGQVQLRTRMRNAGIAGLDRDLLIEQLGITEEQLELLRKKHAEVQEEVRKKLEQLRKEAQDEVLSVLTETQQGKLRKMMGKDYEFKPRQPVPPPKATASPVGRQKN